ncbi:MAG: YihY/virulence factor BrkB family protein [Deltaproteobacteria bacterium]|nr:YihY/virulence factor BrkB family protein [Deltaproteobacteria bacterium]
MSIQVADIIRFLKKDVWSLRPRDLSRGKFLLIRNLKIVLLAFKGFNEDKCGLRAKALTFYSMMSVVPVLALAFGISKGFGMQEMLEKEIIEKMKGQEEVLRFIIGFADKMLEQVKGGIIAGIGVLFLLYTVFKLLQNIEESFNDIWGVPHSRSFSRRLSDYLSVLFIGPILFILSSSTTVFIKTQITDITEKITLLGPVSPLILLSLNILPFFVIWLLFTFVYIYMPNTRVSYKSGVLGGIAAGTMYVLWQFIYLTLQIGVSKYGAIYGSFAVIPLFMIWLQVSWLIVLFGAEIAFAHQNVDTYEMEPISETVSIALKMVLAIRIAGMCVQNFVKGERPLAGKQISDALELPVRLTNRLLSDLVECNVLSETKGKDEKLTYYQPARDVAGLTIHDVIMALERLGDNSIIYADSDELEKIKRYYSELDSITARSGANILLKDI